MSAPKNRFCQQFNLRHPIVSAPMAFAGGGALAAAVSRAGGLGLIGGGYGDRAWLEAQFSAAQGVEGVEVGVGFITWALNNSPSVLTEALQHRPSAVMLSFGDPRPFADEIRAAGAKLICQCQTLDHVRDAVAAGADVVVAQGSEAGGHGAMRATFTLVPETADLLAQLAPDTLLLAAGGIADGRGLAAAHVLGAQGALIGTRFWASKEALVHAKHHATLVAATGDHTIRTTVPDLARQLDWPADFTARVCRSGFVQRWHGREESLTQNLAKVSARYPSAFAQGDSEHAAVWFGESAGLIQELESAADIVAGIATQAAELLSHTAA